ncbi:E3 ubiquitin-protein ligase PRT1-like [Rosa rugosa]|uniref:E3 ubiquitin-protein ligase PRT1-like n=1 Tax=Rosa rugosa TaxID=74645 RepID=UPI002B4110C8|nr:E3 ubiquitin-protein ligase PRT1-like [Rosa rugosa]
MENVTDQVKNLMLCQQRSGSPKQISVADVLCAACKELLFRPVVLNCGHVYCESCIVKQDEEKIRRQVCQSFHPTGLLDEDLQNFLVEQFPKELAHRRDGVQLKHVNPTACESKSSKEAEKSSGSYHIGVGCDYCGMYQIIGDRYRCKDCVEKIGFDLCNDCYNTSSKLPCRFNQQHTAEHQFELIRGNIIRDQFKDNE